MMGRLEGRVVIVTGAGRGLGRAHALFLAAEGAKIVVNDLGATVHGEGADVSPAVEVAEDIRAMGGAAIASGHDVANWEDAGAMIQLAVETFGDLHGLVNNAGIVRDRTLANMSEREWDDVIRVHLKGHAAPTHHVLAYWRAQSRAGQTVEASIVHTSSIAGLAGYFGQANYSTAKLGVLALSRVAALEGERYGVRSNVVSPGGRTRIAMTMPGADSALRAPDKGFDYYDPANVSPLIGWLMAADCPATAQVFHITGNQLIVSAMPPILHKLETEGRWTLGALDRALAGHLVTPVGVDAFHW
jgi:NAD(P)-dependent dehydrogenase (short-subunit alcohol dehydrogenase family)